MSDRVSTEGAAFAPRGDGFIVTAIGLALRLCLVGWAAARIPPTADGVFYHQVAQRIAAGHGYTWLWEDGAVTYAAHYPVGYPALLGGAYALFGGAPAVAMVVNAVLGAAACWAVHHSLRARGRTCALVGGLLVALHPGLLAYTPALMSEGVTAALWAIALALAVSAERATGGRAFGFLVGCGLAFGVATLVRPQSILLAPVVAATLGPPSLPWRRRAWAAALVTGAALATCAPWTLRNCERMGRCAFVSVNGGWNLLIGTQPEGSGAWSELVVPEACKAVFDEAEKDRCFGVAARERIASAPGAWLSLAPRKLNVTFDYCGAGPWYLHQANGEAFGSDAKVVVGAIETAFERLVLLLALCGAWARGARARWRGLRVVVLVVGGAFALQEHATPAYAALVLLLLAQPRRTVIDMAAVAAVGSVALVHAVFFGAGRYQLVLWPLLSAVAALHLEAVVGAVRRWRVAEDTARRPPPPA